MSEGLEQYTRQMADCRSRWNRRTLEYVLESARILQEAREAAIREDRWSRWLREGAHMNRTTAFRHLKVAAFINANVALKQHFATLSLSKVYALTRINPEQASRWAVNPKVREMSDARFAEFIRPHLPTKKRPSAPNLLRSILAALERAERNVVRWQKTRRGLPLEHRAQIVSRLQELLQVTRQVAVA